MEHYLGRTLRDFAFASCEDVSILELLCLNDYMAGSLEQNLHQVWSCVCKIGLHEMLPVLFSDKSDNSLDFGFGTDLSDYLTLAVANNHHQCVRYFLQKNQNRVIFENDTLKEQISNSFCCDAMESTMALYEANEECATFVIKEAIRFSHIETLRAAKERGCSFVGTVLNEPLCFAAAIDNLECIKFIVEECNVHPAGIERKQKPLIRAICTYHWTTEGQDIILYLLSRPGVDPSVNNSFLFYEVSLFDSHAIFEAFVNDPRVNLRANDRICANGDPFFRILMRNMRSHPVSSRILCNLTMGSTLYVYVQKWSVLTKLLGPIVQHHLSRPDGIRYRKAKNTFYSTSPEKKRKTITID